MGVEINNFLRALCGAEQPNRKFRIKEIGTPSLTHTTAKHDNMERIGSDDARASTNKRKRLSTACTRCRNRKVRCDDKLPACTNCQKAGAQCVTQDLRYPNVEVQRREAQSQPYSPSKLIPAKETPQSTGSESTNVQSSSIGETDRSRFNLSSSNGRPQQDSNANGLYSGPLPAIPRFISGNCLFILTQWLDLAFARIGLPERFSWQYRANKLRTEDHLIREVTSPQMRTSGWDSENEALVNRFLATVNLVFPVLDVQDSVLAGAGDTNASAGTDDSTVVETTRLLVLAAGAFGNGTTSEMCSRVLSFAFSKLTVLIQDESIYSISALVLMAILFRSRDDTEMAWRMLANAVPKAQTLGLDTRHPVQSRHWPGRSSRQQCICTWWSLFILDKVLCIEMQRPPLVRDCFCDQEIPVVPAGGPETQVRQRCIEAIIALAKIQGKVCERLLACTRAEESGELTLEQIIREKLRTGGELDQLLLEWVEHLSSDLR